MRVPHMQMQGTVHTRYVALLVGSSLYIGGNVLLIVLGDAL